MQYSNPYFDDVCLCCVHRKSLYDDKSIAHSSDTCRAVETKRQVYCKDVNLCNVYKRNFKVIGL